MSSALLDETRQTGGLVLVFVEDRDSRELIVSVLTRNGYDVVAPLDYVDVAKAAEASPDLVIADGTAAERDHDLVLQSLRSDAKSNAIPFIFLTEVVQISESPELWTDLDGFITTPIRPPELVARVRSMLARTPIDVGERPADRAVPLVEHAFEASCKLELDRTRFAPFSLGILELFEFAGIRESVGAPGVALITREIGLLSERFERIVRVGVDGSGRFMLQIAAGGAEARELLNELSRAIIAHRFYVGVEPIRLTPIVGFVTRTGGANLIELRRRATVSLSVARSHLDLQAVRYSAQLERAAAHSAPMSIGSRLRATFSPIAVPLQVLLTLLTGLVVPFLVYWFLASHGFDITGEMYAICVGMLVLTTIGIWVENALAFKRVDPPSARVYPTASAIIAAYLPNEAATIIETIESFLRVTYAGDVQVILAYNTPRPLPMEEELHAIALRDPRFLPLRVYGSTSKAQNVNAALRSVRGAFVGVFDADHKPDPGSFTRAWDWLANGYDVVQGHCSIRNGDASPLARLVAVEFESIYAVSHPGRARMHGFGLFGGSNGYWKSDLLRQTRMHSFMLTEDIDASLRVIEAGYRIASDPKLMSRELAPLTLRAFWNQRLRWAQGWFQVSIKHLIPAVQSPHLNLQQKIGIVHLLLWRECYVWVCLQILPILAFSLFVRHELINWFVPLFVMTTVLTMLTGPLQLLATYVLADREIRARRRWFAWYFVVSFLFFTELKNVISRLAQLKEAMQERAWKVTPRSVPSASKTSAV